MQILYGNDGMNYCTIAKSADVTENILNEIGNRGLLFYDFPKETYSSPDTEPVSFSYIVTSLNDIFPSDMMVITHSKRMGNRKTPSYYSHVEIAPLPKKMTDIELYKILNRKFIKDFDVMGYKEKNIDSFNSMVENKFFGNLFDEQGYLQEPSEDALTKIQVSAILRLLYRGLEYLGSPVIVVLDREGDVYNERAREVIFTIYKYIPHILREKISFCTYYSLGVSKIDGICLVLVEKTTNYRNYKNVVDLNKTSYEEIGEEKIEIEESISYMIERRRRNSLMLYDDFMYENMNVADSINLFNDISNCHNIKKQDLDSKVLEKYADYFYYKYNKSGRLVVEMKEALQEKLKEYKKINRSNFYEEELKNVIYNEKKNQWFSINLVKYIRLGEVLEVRFSLTLFQKWLEENILKPIYVNNRNNKKEILSEINKVEENLQKSRNLGKEQFKKLCLELYKYVDRKKKEIETNS